MVMSRKKMSNGHIISKKYPYKTIGNRLRFLRGNATQSEFASAIGISMRGYQRYELGERLPNFQTIIKISALCDVDLNWIFKGEKKAPSPKEVAVIREIFNRAKSKFSDWTVEDLIKQHKRFTKEKKILKSKLDRPFRKRDPRLPLAIDMLKEIFSRGGEDSINQIMSVLETLSTFASFGIPAEIFDKLIEKKKENKDT